MLMLKISDTKLLMQKLLLDSQTAFDSFLMAEATVKMGQTFSIDGHINSDFYTEEDLSLLKEEAKGRNQIYDENLVRWSSVKSHVLSIVKGRKTPLSFNIIFYLSKENSDKFLSGINISSGALTPDRLMLRLKYTDGVLYALSGTSYAGFSLDKTVDKAWDEMILKFFTSLGIAYEELS